MANPSSADVTVKNVTADVTKLLNMTTGLKWSYFFVTRAIKRKSKKTVKRIEL